jgi:hypothetical protein
MAIELELNLSEFLRALNATPEAVGDAAKTGMHEVMDDWLRKSRDLAPMKTGQLRRTGFTTEVEGTGIDVEGTISARAVEVADKGKWASKEFNYAYWLHEIYPKKYGDSFKNPTTPGTIPQFLDKPAIDNEDKWMRKIEKEIEEELKQKGW